MWCYDRPWGTGQDEFGGEPVLDRRCRPPPPPHSGSSSRWESSGVCCAFVTMFGNILGRRDHIWTSCWPRRRIHCPTIKREEAPERTTEIYLHVKKWSTDPKREDTFKADAVIAISSVSSMEDEAGCFAVPPNVLRAQKSKFPSLPAQAWQPQYEPPLPKFRNCRLESWYEEFAAALDRNGIWIQEFMNEVLEYHLPDDLKRRLTYFSWSPHPYYDLRNAVLKFYDMKRDTFPKCDTTAPTHHHPGRLPHHSQARPFPCRQLATQSHCPSSPLHIRCRPLLRAPPDSLQILAQLYHLPREIRRSPPSQLTHLQTPHLYQNLWKPATPHETCTLSPLSLRKASDLPTHRHLNLQRS
ncbi:hypothetical protein HPB51_020007 [Rhipicephalus microplus]|uniref:Uncharacterized protein n=1 Tax=Rhipicephalus microplus TaxID=6941 RepID=A0A9J6E3G3_RHIMP|nr:hypothetical protein HPB51_020007 [Rhipicephalus microplus]